MVGLVAGRLGQMVVTLVIVSALVWLAMGLMPGDPLDLAMLSDPAMGAADVARMRALHGLDQPLYQRYLAWAGAVLRGDFGYSRLYAVRAADVLWPALGSTLVLLGWALLLSAVVGIGAGVWGAVRRGAAPLADGAAILA
ncbi:MAG: ABC transporter permease, partial [Acetobacteraceae bacterium]